MGRCFLCVVTCLSFLPVFELGAAEAEVAAAEVLVRSQYHEMLPIERAQALTPAATARLAQMLGDPAERSHYANIVTALGMSGQEGAYEALVAYANRPPSGEVDSDEYRARLALRGAMGHLAASDPRALQHLIRELRQDTEPVGWTYRHLDGARLRQLLRRAAATGLGISGQPAAAVELQRLKARADRRPDQSENWRQHLESVGRLCERVQRQGRLRVFSSPDEREGPR
jgi:hypothetical protein